MSFLLRLCSLCELVVNYIVFPWRLCGFCVRFLFGWICDMAEFSDSHSWIFHGFPELDPDAILRKQPGNNLLATDEERQRAWWIWRRRPPGMNVLAYGVLLWVGAIAHTPFLLLGSPQLFCLFHACYILFVLWVVTVFLIRERRYRRWKKDYLRAVARLVSKN
jgi:hypothetical protein